MNRLKLIIGLTFCIIFFHVSCLPAQIRPEGNLSGVRSSEQSPTPLCLRIGEKFTYTLNWGIIPAGFATMEVDSLVRWGGGVDCYQVRIAANTNSFLDKVHKVRDTVVSLIETSLKRSQYYRKEQKEGSFYRDDELIIDYQKAGKLWSPENQLNKQPQNRERGIMQKTELAKLLWYLM